MSEKHLPINTGTEPVEHVSGEVTDAGIFTSFCRGLPPTVHMTHATIHDMDELWMLYNNNTIDGECKEIKED